MSMPGNRDTAESPPAIPMPPETAAEDWSLDHLITDDDTPVDNLYIEKLLRLLVHVLYSSWTPPAGQPFRAMSDVGLFFVPKNPAIVPDLMLAVGVQTPANVTAQQHRSYFVWIVGKVPDLVLEVVSDRRGGEDTTKMAEYATRGIPYYIIFDPEDHLGGGELRAFQLQAGTYQPIDPVWIPALELGLTFWEGKFEELDYRWLRWCDRSGQVLLTAAERAELERQRAQVSHERAEKERQMREHEQRKLERLEKRLKDLGIDPDSLGD